MSELSTTKEFKKGLERLINEHSMENHCDMPDFILSEMVANFIKYVGPSIKHNLDWHGCDSICHPKADTDGTLTSKYNKLKELLLLTDPVVSSVVAGETQLKQWEEFSRCFPDEKK